MTAATITAICSVVCTLIACGVFIRLGQVAGKFEQRLEDMEKRQDKQEDRCDRLHPALGFHAEVNRNAI